MKSTPTTLVCLLCAVMAAAQSHQRLFPTATGPALLDSLVLHYKPSVVLDYANARDTLYAKVFAADNDTVRCIYSDHALYLSPTADPTQYIYLNGSSLGMNAEHAYPQAKGAAEGNARSDMHHLFATRIPVNEARGNLPYSEIPDAQTSKWFYRAEVVTSVPAVNKDLYSEQNSSKFEPREASKGDLARAVFYFFTMYNNEAMTADPLFFEQQRETLCTWHQQDPVTAEEMVKTLRIAPYQEGKANPFIIDCTLAQRTYCPSTTTNCLLDAGNAALPALVAEVNPLPFHQLANLRVELPFTADLYADIYAADGRILKHLEVKSQEKGTYNYTLALEGATPQLMFLVLKVHGASGQQLLRTLPLVSE